MPSPRAALAAVFSILVAAVPAKGAAQAMRTLTTSRQYHGQDSLKARVEFAAGNLRLLAGPATLLYAMHLSYDEDRFVPVSRFVDATGEVFLGLDRTGSGGLRVNSPEHLAQDATIELSPKSAVSLDVSLGAVDADIDLGGIRLRSLRLATAASRTKARFSSPNPEHCDSMTLNAGAAEFSVTGLGNSHCDRIDFEGGVGAVTLDLTGAWADDATLAAKIAVGELTLQLPKGLGIELTLDKFLSSFQPRGFTRQGRSYLSEGYGQAQRKVRIEVTSAMGGVNVVWVK